jgi:hypothetical protein
MSIFRLILAIVLFCLGTWIVVCNWHAIAWARQNKRKGIKKGYSQIGFLSLIFCVVAGLIYPYSPKWWIFLPTVLDPGTWILFYLPIVIVREWPFKKDTKD